MVQISLLGEIEIFIKIYNLFSEFWLIINVSSKFIIRLKYNQSNNKFSRYIYNLSKFAKRRLFRVSNYQNLLFKSHINILGKF